MNATNISDIIEELVEDASFTICSEATDVIDCGLLAGLLAAVAGIAAAAVVTGTVMLRKKTRKMGQRQNRGSV